MGGETPRRKGMCGPLQAQAKARPLLWKRAAALAGPLDRTMMADESG